MATTLPISKVKTQLVGEYERLKSTLDVLGDPDLMRQIRASERHFARGGKGWSFEEVFGEPLRRPKQRAL